jgi:rhodanese-related sulfurtransferase/polyisoprenoid-binding protein YceI
MVDDTRTITASDLDAARSAGNAPLIVDVLPPHHWEACRLPEAANACIYEVAFGDRIRELAPDTATSLVVYGASDATQEALAAASRLAELGYTDVQVLAGGLAGWHAAGLPLDGTADAPPRPLGPPALQDGSWRLNTDQSWLRWVGRNPNGFHDGSVDLAAGSIAITAGKAEGSFEVDVMTMRNDDLAGDPSQPVLIAHLLSGDFLLADRFPRAVFELVSVAPLEDAALTTPTHRVVGNLALRGMTALLTFDAVVTDTGDGKLAVEAHFDLDRTRWGMIYGSARFFAHLGMHVVFDHVGISLRLALDPA